MQHRGYFFVPVTGSYTIVTSFADDLLLAWVGPAAFSGYSRSNAVLSNTWNNYSPTYTFTATEGQYIPIRFIWAQGYGPWGLSMTLTGPNMTNIITSGQSSRYLLKFGCNNAAPQYPAFGSER